MAIKKTINAAPDAAAISRYVVKVPLNHDQVDYAVGEKVELDDTAAAQLLAVAAIAAVDPA